MGSGVRTGIRWEKARVGLDSWLMCMGKRETSKTECHGVQDNSPRGSINRGHGVHSLSVKMLAADLHDDI